MLCISIYGSLCENFGSVACEISCVLNEVAFSVFYIVRKVVERIVLSNSVVECRFELTGRFLVLMNNDMIWLGQAFFCLYVHNMYLRL